VPREEWEWDAKRALNDLVGRCEQILETATALAPPLGFDFADQDQVSRYNATSLHALKAVEELRVAVQDAADRLWRLEHQVDPAAPRIAEERRPPRAVSSPGSADGQVAIPRGDAPTQEGLPTGDAAPPAADSEAAGTQPALTPEDELQAREILTQVIARDRETLDNPTPAGQDATAWPTLLSATDLADRLGQSRDAVSAWLRRYRRRFPDCVRETEGARRNDPRYLYRTADVLPDLREHFGLTDP
jgi:hypothetical protein